MRKIFTFLIGLIGIVSANAQCDYTVTMQDSWGDGWNGASIGIEVNGIPGNSISIDGAEGTETIGTFTGDIVEFTWAAGSYDGEITFQISDPSGAEIYNGGAPDDGENFLSSTSNATCAPPSCPTPTLTGLTVNSESAVATWANDDNFTSFTIEIGDTGFVQGTGTEYTVNETTYTFTGLSENTFYSFYLSSACGNDQGAEVAGPYNFETYCNTVNTGWSEDWGEEDALNLSGCNWSVFNVNGGNNWFITTEGNYYIYNYGEDPTDYLMSPAFTCTDGVSDRVRFDANSQYYADGGTFNDELTIGVYDAAVENDLGVLATIVPQADFNTYEYDLSAYEGQDIRFYILAANGSNGVTRIDNVIVDAFPSCTAPSDLSAANSTETTSDLSWTSAGTETTWNIEYGLINFAQGEGTIESSSSSSYQLTNLEGGSNYHAYVQADCGSGEVSDWVGPVTFSTLGSCGFMTLELIDDYGDGWNGNSLEVVVNSTVVGTYTISSGASASYIIPIDKADIVDLNYLNTGTWGGENGWNVYAEDGTLILAVPFTGNGGATGAGPENTVGLEICPCEVTNNISETACDSYTWTEGDGNTYTEGGTYTIFDIASDGCDSIVNLTLTVNQSTGNNESYTACLTHDWYGQTYTEDGTYYAQGLNSAGCVLYDTLVLTISTEATTIDPIACDSYTWNDSIYTSSTTATFSGGCGDDIMNLTINNSYDDLINQTACDSFAWDNGITYLSSGTYEQFLETSEGCDSIVTLELVINITEYVDTAVSECSSYDFNGEILTISGEYIDTVQSTTGCDSIVALSLTITGIDSINLEVIECDADSYDWDGVTYTESGNYVNSYQNEYGCDSVVSLSLTFNDPYAGAFVETLDEGRANFAAATTLPNCWNLENTGLATWANSGDGITMWRFNNQESGPTSGVNGEGEYLYVQTYDFNNAPNYAAHLDSSVINTKEVDLSSMTAPELNFYYQMNGVSMGHLSVWVNDDNGLTEIFTKSGDQGNSWSEESISLSDYSGTVNFVILSILDTTGTGSTSLSEMAIDNFEVREQPSCYSPYNVIQTAVDATTASFEWSTNASITAWNVVVVEEGEDPLAVTPDVVTEGSVTLTDLTAATNYEFYVQSDCGDAWEGPFAFTTLFPQNYGCPHAINMVDDYGDGWNGGSVDILVNGIFVATASIETGAEATLEFGAEDSDNIQVTNFVPGSWVAEIGFEIVDGSGTVIYESAIGELTNDSEIDTTLNGFCPQNDISSIAAAIPSGCDLTNAEDIEIWVYNAGVATETGFTVSYAVNGGTAVEEIITESVEPGDTLMYVFTTQADMSEAGDYDVTLYCSLSTDIFSNNDTVVAMGMNTISPSDPTTMGDTSCVGSTASLMATSEEYVVWYNAEGNVVGTGESLMAMDSVTSSYYAEAVVADGYTDDFESYSSGDFIAESNTEEWATWPGGTLGGQYDAPVSDDQAASGSNSLHLDNAEPNVPDPVMIFGGQTWNSGTFEFSMNMYVATSAYFNLQGSANIGTVWAMQVTFDDQGAYDFEGGTLTGSYPGTGQWFNITLKCNDLTTSTWELFIDGESQGSATLPNGSSVGGCNFYAADGNDYYVDDVSWTAASADACRSGLVEVVSTVEECLGINGIVSETIEVYPNPNNGEFMVSNTSEIITITITDVQGKTVHSMNNLNIDKVNIDMTDLEKGMYLINIETGSGTVTKPVMLK